jgi:hypothetical protein
MLPVTQYLAAPALLLALTAPAVAAQPPYGHLNPDGDTGAEVRLLAINVAIGALTAGLYQWARGGRVLPAARTGAIGGAFAYAGKRVAVERWPAAGLVGREIGAVGHSLIRNGSDGRSAFDQLILPVGPVRFYVQPDSVSPIRLRVDLLTTVYAAMLAAAGRPLDINASFSSGALVFKVTDDPVIVGVGRCRSGLTLGGIVLLTDVSGLATDDRNPTWAHERVHIGQFDQLFTTLSDPAEEWLARNVRGGAKVKSYIDFNLVALALVIPMVAIRYENQPWEREAYRITRQTFGDAASAEDFTCPSRGPSGG